jgi:hypothetical protein
MQELTLASSHAADGEGNWAGGVVPAVVGKKKGGENMTHLQVGPKCSLVLATGFLVSYWSRKFCSYSNLLSLYS